jgi:hypothetical protein
MTEKQQEKHLDGFFGSIPALAVVSSSFSSNIKVFAWRFDQRGGRAEIAK